MNRSIALFLVVIVALVSTSATNYQARDAARYERDAKSLLADADRYMRTAMSESSSAQSYLRQAASYAESGNVEKAMQYQLS